MATTTTSTLNQDRLQQILGQAVGEIGAGINGALVILGDRLGLYKAMAGAGPLTSEELAKKTGLNERYVREWLSAQAAGNFIEYDPATRSFTLTNEYAEVLANEAGPAFLPAAFEVMRAMMIDEPRLEEAFKTGKGVGWEEHHPCLFSGTARFFKPAYLMNLVQSWLPALDRVVEKLQSGAKVADIGCGQGTSTIIMAQAYKNSRFWGFDYHQASVDAARKAAEDAGVGDRCTFEVASSKAYPGVLRLPSRHGRPGRSGSPRSQDSEAGWNMAHCRAIR
jgi:hypothetical protein